MSNLLSSLSKTIHASLALAILLFIGLFYLNGGFAFDTLFWSWLFRYIHVIVAIMWIGLLWYFNFVQIPNMGKIPDEQKPAIGKVIAPAALFYFRCGAERLAQRRLHRGDHHLQGELTTISQPPKAPRPTRTLTLTPDPWPQP